MPFYLSNPFRVFLAIFLLGIALSCQSDREKKSTVPVETPEKTVKVPVFDRDSCYAYIRRQVEFGPRVPNQPAHRRTADFLVNTLKRFGAQVNVQEFKATTFDGTELSLKNIIASFQPEKQKRILLAAHWDTRPFADKDKTKTLTPIDGANDGASGVGVLLEIARHLHNTPPDAGVDIILFDGEDWGEKEGEKIAPDKSLDSWWCLGSQHWSRNKHKPNYSAYFGILLDMVGAKDARFHREGYSLEFAPGIVEKVWNTASRLGFSHVFIRQNQDGIIDDHLFVNTRARIPMINIVQFDPAHGFFGDYHHTHKDNLELISKETLFIVGTTVANVVYHE